MDANDGISGECSNQQSSNNDCFVSLSHSVHKTNENSIDDAQM